MSASIMSVAQAPAGKSIQIPAAPRRADSAIAIEETEEQESPAPARRRRSSVHMLLDEAILARHSTRLYLPQAVPRALLERALDLATHAPSNTNTQARRLFIVTGEALARLKSGLVRAAENGAPDLPSMPPAFWGYRTALGKQLYGEGWGLARDDAAGRRAAVMRNFEFFGAPVAAIVCMSRELVGQEAFSVGMYVQTFLLALTEMGVGSCCEISVAGYPDVVRSEVGIPDDLQVLCGVAVGFEDESAGVNRIRVARDDVERNTVWVQ